MRCADSCRGTGRVTDSLVRALVCHQLTGPGDLVYEDDFPPPSTAPGAVRIEVSRAGVNFPDLLMTFGRYQFRPELPFAPGLEVAGTVTEAAGGVGGFSPGDRVMAVVGHGGWATEVVAPAAMTFPAPRRTDRQRGRRLPSRLRHRDPCAHRPGGTPGWRATAGHGCLGRCRHGGDPGGPPTRSRGSWRW